MILEPQRGKITQPAREARWAVVIINDSDVGESGKSCSVAIELHNGVRQTVNNKHCSNYDSCWYEKQESNVGIHECFVKFSFGLVLASCMSFTVSVSKINIQLTKSYVQKELSALLWYQHIYTQIFLETQNHHQTRLSLQLTKSFWNDLLLSGSVHLCYTWSTVSLSVGITSANISCLNVSAE